MRKPAKVKITRTQPKSEERNEPKINKELVEIQKALRTAQAEAKREHQARLQAEKALSKAQEKLADTPLETERNPKPLTRRISFVVRLTLDEQGQYSRTEIEHVSSGRKQNFLGFDGDRLISFMKACINPANTLEDYVSTKPS